MVAAGLYNRTGTSVTNGNAVISAAGANANTDADGNANTDGNGNTNANANTTLDIDGYAYASFSANVDRNTRTGIYANRNAAGTSFVTFLGSIRPSGPGPDRPGH